MAPAGSRRSWLAGTGIAAGRGAGAQARGYGARITGGSAEDERAQAESSTWSDQPHGDGMTHDSAADFDQPLVAADRPIRRRVLCRLSRKRRDGTRFRGRSS